MIAGNTKEYENLSVACKHGVPSVDLNLKQFSDEKSNRANVLYTFEPAMSRASRKNDFPRSHLDGIVPIAIGIVANAL